MPDARRVLYDALRALENEARAALADPTRRREGDARPARYSRRLATAAAARHVGAGSSVSKTMIKDWAGIEGPGALFEDSRTPRDFPTMWALVRVWLEWAETPKEHALAKEGYWNALWSRAQHPTSAPPAGAQKDERRELGHALPTQPTQIFAQPPALHSPAQLLRADAKVVPFIGRQEEMTRLQEWCSSSSRFSAYLVAGQGGEGKSRLAHELVAHRQDARWAAGLIVESTISVTSLQLDRPFLFVVDYSETQATILEQLSRVAIDAEHPVRILLLARSDGEWRTTIAASSPHLTWLLGLPIMDLGSLTSSRTDAQEAWATAVEWLGNGLSQLEGYHSEDWESHTQETLLAGPMVPRTDSGDVTALTIQMDALASLLRRIHPSSGLQPSIEEVLLLHERRYWHNAATAAGVTLSGRDESQAIAIATAWGAADLQQALAILQAHSGTSDLTRTQRVAISDWLAMAIPSPGRYWGGLLPDRLGEHHLAKELREEPQLLLSSASAASPDQARRAMVVLARTSERNRSVQEALDSLLATFPTVFIPAALEMAPAVADPQPIFSGVRRVLTDFDVDEAPSIMASLTLLELPIISNTLQSVACEIGNLFIERIRLYYSLGHDFPHDVYASALRLTALREGYLGRHSDSLAKVLEATEVVRRLADSGESAHQMQLTVTLNDLAIRLGAVGRHEDGLLAADEAIALLRTPTPDDHQLMEVGAALVVRGARLAALGRLGEAFAANTEAVSSLKAHLASPESSATDRHQTNGHLLSALNSLSRRHYELGDMTKAADVAAEAVSIARSIVSSCPDEGERQLALTLIALASALGSTKQEDALASIDEAIEISRHLAAFDSPELSALLANALQIKASLLRAEMEQAERIELLEQSALLLRGSLIEGEQATAMLHASLLALAEEYRAANCFPKVEIACAEATSLYRSASISYRSRMRDTHLGVLWCAYKSSTSSGANENRSLTLAALIDFLGESARESRQDYWSALASLHLRESDLALSRMYLDSASSHASDAAAILPLWLATAEGDDDNVANVMGGICDAAGRLKDHGLELECLTLLSHVIDAARTRADASRPIAIQLAASLFQRARIFHGLNRTKEACIAIEEVLSIRRGLADADQDEPGLLVTALGEKSRILQDSGKFQKALETLEEAISIYRSLETPNPSLQYELPKMLSSESLLLGKLGRPLEGLRASEEAVTLGRSMLEPANSDSTLALASSLNNLAYRLWDLGRWGDSLAAIREELELFRSVLADRPDQRLRFSQILESVALNMKLAGRPTDAKAARREASQLRQSMQVPHSQ